MRSATSHIDIKRSATDKAFTLIELLVVVAIISSLTGILLPALASARDFSRQVVCASQLHTLSQGSLSYAAAFNDWIVGSPNTTGSVANPGGWRLRLYDGQYYIWDETLDTRPAVHIFDFSSPLMPFLGQGVADDIAIRYRDSKLGPFRCPDTRWQANVNHTSRIKIDTFSSSYATCRYFTYVPTSRRQGAGPNCAFFAHPFVPDHYLPRLGHIENAATKVFLADACKVDRSDPHRLGNMDYGYTTHGAYLNEHDINTDSPSLSYRFEPARSESFRHNNGINMLFFDGHVKHCIDGSSESNNGFGDNARRADFWFPSGTDIAELPVNRISNPDIIVP